MVLGELGGQLANAVKKLSAGNSADEKAVEAVLKEITDALLQADVDVKKVVELKRNVYNRAKPSEGGQSLQAGRAVQKAVFEELCDLLDGGKPWQPKKGRRSVVMLVGLQGSGKTTTAAKYARWHRKKGYNPALIGADTFRAGALDQLKQAAARASLPFYGSYSETDPAKVAREGVDKLSGQGHDLLVVDTSGRHRQSEELLEEVTAVSAAIEPDATVFVMDATVGQAVKEQAEAFKRSSGVSGVVITKLDGHAKGGGAISAVAATGSPIMFLGTGEHLEQIEQFNPRGFVSRLLGLGDLSGFADKVSDALPDEEDQTEFFERMTSGKFTPRLLKEQYSSLLRMGPMSQVMSMLPGPAQQLMPEGKEAESQAKVKRMLTMLDSMREWELDCQDPKQLAQPQRLERIARGSGRGVREALELVEEFKRMSHVMSQMKNLKMPKKSSIQSMQNQTSNAQQLAKALPQGMLQQIGGQQGLQQMLKQLEGSSKDPTKLLSQLQQQQQQW